MEYEKLDPVYLLTQLESLQDEFWKYSWDKSGNTKENYLETDETIKKQSSKETPINIADKLSRDYHKNDKVDFRKSPRTWRTRKDLG